MLRDQIQQDIIAAMKAGDKNKVETLRFLSAEIKNVEIDNGEQDDAGVQGIIRRQIKQIDEAIPQYEKGGRVELVAAEKAKKAVLQAYLPAEMSDEDLLALVTEVVASVPEPTVGSVMPLAMKKVAGQASGGRVAAVVNQLLAQQ